MATASHATLLSAPNASTFPFNLCKSRVFPTRFRIRASSQDSDCNDEECAPDKEVGKVSMEWVAEDRTKVVGTFPPRKRGFTGYVEKDTAGQTNIYSVEPAVYIAESVISSGTSGSSADGAENTAAITFGLALIAVAAASSILLQVGKSQPSVQATQYSGPALSYYIDKFKPPEIIQVSVPVEAPNPSTDTTAESPPEVPQVQVESGVPVEPSTTVLLDN